MLTAKQALEITLKKVKELTIQKYEPIIKEAAEKGERTVKVKETIRGLEKTALEELGYKVQVKDDEFYHYSETTIGW